MRRERDRGRRCTPLQINPLPTPIGGEMTSLLRTFATSCSLRSHPTSNPFATELFGSARGSCSLRRAQIQISPRPPYFKDERADLWPGRSRTLPTAADTNCSVFRWFFQPGKPGPPVRAYPVPARTNKHRASGRAGAAK